MLTIKSELEIEQAAIPITHKALLFNLWENLVRIPGYQAEADGFIVYLETTEVDQQLTALGFDCKLAEMGFDGCCYYPDAQCYELISIINNSFGWTFIVPHSATFNPEVLPWLAGLLEESRCDAE